MNIYGAKGYLTPDDVPEDSQCRIFQIPNSTAWLANFMGALLPLIYSENWQEYGALTPDEAADTALDIIWEAYNNSYCTLDVPAPYWETAANADDELPTSAQGWYGELAAGAALVAAPGGFLAFDAPDDYHWTEKIADWIITGFIAIAFTPAAGIKYITFVPRARLAFRRQDWGAFARIFVNGILDREIDTYSPVEDLINVEVDLTGYAANEDGSREVWVANSEDHNAEATPTADGYGIAVVRKRIDEGQVMSFELRQNPDNSCQMQQSIDGGETWTLAFDYSVCVPPAIQTILETTMQNNTYISPFSPTITFITQAGYDDAQTEAAYQALCFAATFVVKLLCDAVYQQRTAGISAANYVEAALALATAVVGAIALAITVPVLGWVAAAGAIVVAVIALAETIATTSAGIWIDSDNRAALACLLLANLANTAVSMENFQTAFDHADCLTADQQTMAGILTQILTYPAQQAQMYAAFLANIAEVNSAAQSAALDVACGCEGSWSFSWDFSLGNYGIWNAIFGTVLSGGLQCGENVDGWPSIGRVDASFYMPDGSEVTQIDVYYQFPTSGYSWQARFAYAGYGGASNTVSNPASCPVAFTSNTPGSGSKSWSIYATAGGTGGDMLITGIKFTGTGASPFGLCNNNPPC